MNWNPSRRRSLRASAAMMGTGLLQARGTGPVSQSAATDNPQKAKPMQPISSPIVHHDDNVLRVTVPFSFAENINRVNIGLTCLYNAGFTITDQETGSRHCRRLTDTDARRIAGLQDVAAGRVRTPKVLMGLRGSYGTTRTLPHIDFALLGAGMHERGMPFFGFNDVCAIQLTLLIKDNIPSFTSPIVYSEFGKSQPSTYTMDPSTHDPTSAGSTIDVPAIQRNDVDAEGTFWGGNLSVLASLAGSPYMPDIQGGILFIEDVGGQPYHIKRILGTLYLTGVLQKQRAIVFGDSRMSTIYDIYDSNYDFPSVVSQIQHTIRVLVLTGFPFGHVANKSTFPLGAHAKVRGSGSDGYSITFSGYPALNAATLNLNSLLPLPITLDNYVPIGNEVAEEVLE